MAFCCSSVRHTSNRTKPFCYKWQSRDLWTGPRWRRSALELTVRGRITMAEGTETLHSIESKTSPAEESSKDESQVETRPGWQEILRRAFEKARREGHVANRRELGRDRSRSLFLLVGVAIALLLLFLGVFSSPNGAKKTVGRLPGTPDLGRRITPGQQNPGQAGSVAPLLSADAGRLEGAGNQDVTAEDVS